MTVQDKSTMVGRAESRSRETRPRRAGAARPARPLRILVADDEHLVATELTFALGSLGYVVIGPVTDGQSALDLARKALPDLALLDIRMPRLDGLAAAKELSEDLDIPCVIISAYPEPEYVEAAAETGLFGYLVKPVQEDQLRVSIDMAWRRYCRHTVEREENRLLSRRLEERKVIEKAKWALVSTRSISEPAAMDTLRSRARDTRRPMVDVAKDVIKESGQV